MNSIGPAHGSCQTTGLLGPRTIAHLRAVVCFIATDFPATSAVLEMLLAGFAGEFSVTAKRFEFPL